LRRLIKGSFSETGYSFAFLYFGSVFCEKVPKQCVLIGRYYPLNFLE
jgi:hypothetical protein